MTSKIALFGPVLPFRGGIAQHTTMLRRALSKQCELRTLSFSRQYPRWVFPGKSDRDEQYKDHVEPDVDYVIDSLNPLTWRKAMRQCLEFGPDAIIIPWWTVFWAPCFGYLARCFLREKLPLLFLCHNVVDHEVSVWKRMATTRVLRQGTGFVTHSRRGADEIKLLIGTTEASVYPHPIYDHFPKPQGKLEKRAALELLFFGFVRPYKGLDVLLDAMRLLASNDVHLSIVGEFWDGHHEIEERMRNSGVENRIELIPRYVDEAEAAEYFERADAVVLPYRTATGTGVIPIAYHYGRPVIATDVGGLPDVVQDGKTGLIIPPDSPRALADAIVKLGEMNADMVRTAISEFKKAMSWDGLAEHLLRRLDPCIR